MAMSSTRPSAGSGSNPQPPHLVVSSMKWLILTSRRVSSSRKDFPQGAQSCVLVGTAPTEAAPSSTAVAVTQTVQQRGHVET